MSDTMKVLPYLGFDGQCAEAFRFYEKVLGGELEIMTHAESPMADETPPESRDRVMHASLTSGDLCLMGSDAPLHAHAKPQGLCVSLHLSDADEAERIFQAFADGGSIEMPIGKTFWAERFGMATDRFGIPWMINCAPEA